MGTRTGRRGYRALLAAAVALALALGCSSDAERFREHQARAERYLEQDRLKEALLELRSALQLRPKDAETNFRIAEVLREQERYTDALFFYGEARRLDPEHVRAAMGEAELRLGEKPDRAEELIAQYEESHPKRSLVHRRRAELSLVRGSTQDALEAAHRATALAPDSAAAHFTLGKVHQARILEKRRGPGSPELELFDKAQAAFEKALELDPEHAEAAVERARVLAARPGSSKEERAERGQKAFEEALAVAREAGDRRMIERALNLALQHAQRRDVPEFQRWALEQRVEELPSQLRAWRALAGLEEEREEGAGLAVLDRMLEERPEDADAHLLYAQFLIERGRLDEGLAHLEATAERGLAPGEMLAGVVTQLVRHDREEEAREVLARMERELPEDPRTDYARARLALSDGRDQEAAERLRVLAASQEHAETHRMLALAELRLGNLSAASAAVDRALELEATERPSTLRLKLRIQQRAGDWSGALQTIRSLASLGGDGQTIAPSDRLSTVRALYGVGRREAGRRLLETMLERAPEPVPALAVEFARREGREQPERARRLLEAALERTPGQPPALLAQLARLDQQAGRSERALERLDRALQGERTSLRVLLLRAQVLASMGDYQAAERDAMRVFEAAPETPGVVDLVAGLYVQQGRTEEAIASFQEAREAGALPPAALVLLGRLQLQQGREAEARETLEDALDAGVENAAAMNDLAWILASQGEELDRALELARGAQQRRGEVPAIIDTLGYVYLQRGLSGPAKEQFRYAIDRAREREEPAALYHYHLGLALRAEGEEAEAVDAFERALALDPEFPESAALQGELEAARAALSAPSSS